MTNQKRRCAIAFPRAAVAYYASPGERLMAEIGSCFRSFAFKRACKSLGLKQHAGIDGKTPINRLGLTGS
jgi:hypothetical protein